MDHDVQQYLPDLLALEREEHLNASGCSILLVSRRRGAEDIAGVLEHVRTRPESYCVLSDLQCVVEIFYRQRAKDTSRWKDLRVVGTGCCEGKCRSNVVCLSQWSVKSCAVCSIEYFLHLDVLPASSVGADGWSLHLLSQQWTKELIQLKVEWEELPVFISGSSKEKPGRWGGVLGTSLHQGHQGQKISCVTAEIELRIFIFGKVHGQIHLIHILLNFTNHWTQLGEF